MLKRYEKKTVSKEIPQQLRELVFWSVKILGKAYKNEYGQESYDRLENVRKRMKSLRDLEHDQLFKKLHEEQLIFSQLDTIELSRLATGFSFMLELINRCENAYRSYMLSNSGYDLNQQKPESIIFVLTAHPTESRSPEFLKVFSKIQDVLSKKLTSSSPREDEMLYYLLLVALKVLPARREKPSVFNEAQSIYTYALSQEIIESLIKFRYQGLDLTLRAWVGGDKDGHPGVNEVTMIESLSQSRALIINYIRQKIATVHEHCSLVQSKDNQQVLNIIETINANLSQMIKIATNDWDKVLHLKTLLNKLVKDYQELLLTYSPHLEDINQLCKVFPALVVPLEIREDSAIVSKAIKTSSPYAIEKMLIELKKISKSQQPKCYVRGFILSMVKNSQDIVNGIELVKKVFNGLVIPVVPLMENKHALTHAVPILNDLFKQCPDVVQNHINRWDSHFEVMVGYSDSSKENGVLPSRVMIAKALRDIEQCMKNYKLTPIFFHGSGGSIERGGGTIQDQIRWMPQSALNIYKATVQGEMVARNLGDPVIFESQVTKISNELKLTSTKSSAEISTSLMKLCELISKSYSDIIKDSTFLKVIDKATPYNFLTHLKIGSRPAKRATGGDVTKLRAIPWILCWTQTRVLFPTWFAVGSSYQMMSTYDKEALKNEFKDNPVFYSFISALGFTLSKVELGVWAVYLHQSDLTELEKKETYHKLKNEYQMTLEFFKDITGHENLLWFRPWLAQSIKYRSSMIHPLNLIQLESIKRDEIELLLDTVTGISCGMLTTG